MTELVLAATEGGVQSSSLAPLIIAAPLLMSLILLVAGKRIGKLAGPLASAAVGVSFIASVLSCLKLIGIDHEAHPEAVHLYDWISVGDFRLGVGRLIDQLSGVMLLVATGVGTLIHIYSIGYMHEDPRSPRFFAYLNLFVAFMLILVLAENLLLMFVGWEGVGLCSYLLIGFWFERPAAANAAKKAFIVNRIGDFAFLLGIFVLAASVGTLTLGQINEQIGRAHV